MTTPRSSRRNVAVERAVRHALERIDAFVSNTASLTLPTPTLRHAADDLLTNQHASARLAMLFFVFYWLEVPDWDLDTVPVGARGDYGDKLLSEQLRRRRISLAQIRAFGENLGSKGNVRNFRLSTDPKFSGFLSAVSGAGQQERVLLADYFAYRFAESRVVEPRPLPPIGPDMLTFARAKVLFHELLGLQSSGHIQQFLIAALLSVLRQRDGIDVVTHHPHAADRYDERAGDIEEQRNGQLIRAYEVTVRPDWQNRISDFTEKMDKFNLSKYVIIASNINRTNKWAVPAKMALELEPYEHDIAVVDILDVVHFLSAELSANELRSAVNQAFEYLSTLSERDDYKQLYSSTVSAWLDTAS